MVATPNIRCDRYTFNGMERDDEVKGEGNSINYTFRMHDPRLGRFLSVDPLAVNLPWNSPYSFAENSVIAFVDFEGMEKVYYYYVIKNGLKKPLVDPNTGEQLVVEVDNHLLNKHRTNQTPLMKYFVFNKESGLYEYYEDEEFWGDAELYQIKPDGYLISESIGMPGPTAGEVITYVYDQGIAKVGHNFLDGVGLIPLVGEVADFVNGVWYSLEGNTRDAMFSYAAAIPIIGWASTGAKHVVKTANYTGEIAYEIGSKSTKLFEAKFIAKSGDEIGVLAEATETSGKVLNLSDVTFYGMKADKTAMKGSDLGARDLLKYRESILSWAKENGYEKVIFTGKRAANSSSKNPGMDMKWEIDLTK